MPDTVVVLDDSGDREDHSEDDVDVKALSPWPRLNGRPRRLTYRQVFTRSFVALAVGYVILALWAAIEPYRRPMEPFEKQLVPILLVVMPVLAILAAALTALALSTVWWFCWASWNPHLSDMLTRTAASDPGE